MTFPAFTTRHHCGLSAILAMTAIISASPLAAGPPACTCHNLESLQQDYQNAVYLEKYMRELAEHLKSIEAPLLKARQTDPDSYEASVEISSRTGPARDAYEKSHLKLPFSKIKDYSGPERVPMEKETCQQKQEDLDALENGSPCEAMADAALAHELFHRDNCNHIGVDNYWRRELSEIALEEAQAYHAQAANLKSELRRVLEDATIVYKGRWPFSVSVPGAMHVDYLFVTGTADLGQSSSGDTWAMTGHGTTTTTIETAEIAGRTCRPSGSVNSEFDATLTTNGLTFGLDIRGGVTGGNPAISCPGGMGMGMPPPDPIVGRVATGLPLKEGDNPVGGDWTGPMRGAMAGMGTVSGVADMVASVTCTTK